MIHTSNFKTGGCTWAGTPCMHAYDRDLRMVTHSTEDNRPVNIEWEGVSSPEVL